MSQNRFKMSFTNENAILSKNMMIRQQLQTNNINHAKQFKAGVGRLNTPMIDRVHKSKAGCSACGKRAM